MHAPRLEGIEESEYIPAGQVRHCDDEVAPGVGRNFPDGQVAQAAPLA
jgi:hypothetical protein